MKRIIAAVVLIALVAMLAVTESIYIKKFCSRKKEEITDVKNMYSENISECADSAERFRKDWINVQAKMTLFVNHSLIDQISEDATRIPVYAENRDEAEFYAACADVERTLKQISDDQRITIDSFY